MSPKYPQPSFRFLNTRLCTAKNTFCLHLGFIYSQSKRANRNICSVSRFEIFGRLPIIFISFIYFSFRPSAARQTQTWDLSRHSSFEVKSSSLYSCKSKRLRNLNQSHLGNPVSEILLIQETYSDKKGKDNHRIVFGRAGHRCAPCIVSLLCSGLIVVITYWLEYTM